MKYFLPEDLIGKYLSEDINSSEKQELFAWIEEEEANKKFFEEVVKIWSLSNEDDDFQTDTKAAWDQVESRISVQPKEATIRPMRVAGKLWKVAAAILVLVMASWWLMTDNGKMVEVIALGEEVQEVILPDGSHVWLNENSRLTYNDKFSPRNIELSGEAFFEVERNEKKPFTIYAGNATTRVLGTSFNVKAYQQVDSIVVTVTTGKVSVQNAKDENQKVILIPGEVGVVYKKEEKVEKLDAADENYISWKTKELHFNSLAMSEIIPDLEDYFNIQIKVTNSAILDCHYLGTFKDPELDKILEAFEFTMDLEIEKSENIITIKGTGCKH